MADETGISESQVSRSPDGHSESIIKGIEKYCPIERQADGSFLEKKYGVVTMETTGLLKRAEVYDVNAPGTHTSGRRGGLEDALTTGMEPFATPVNEDITETSAVVCGYLADNQSVTESETFKRDYGHIFDEDSEGYVLVMDKSLVESEGYEKVGPEARISRTITPNEYRAIIVGNEVMFKKAVDLSNRSGLSLAVIQLSRTQTKV